MRVHALQQLSEGRAVGVVVVKVMWFFISNWQACLKQQALRLSVAVLCKICLKQPARLRQLAIWRSEVEQAYAVCVDCVEQLF